MKAVVFHEHGDVDVLKYEDVEEPQVGKGDVKIKIHACALNHLDIWVRQGGRRVSIPMPHISGSDIAGTVAEAGEGAHNFKLGQRVIVAPGLAPKGGKWVFTNRDSGDSDYKIIGYQIQGGYAEYITVPRRQVFPVSDQYSFEEWASFPLVFLTSYHMLFNRLKIQCGETILIQAAGSGLGIAAIQLAKHAGVRVITTAGSDEKLEKARALGADETINYNTTDFVQATMDLTEGQGVDCVFDHVGGETFEKSLQTLKNFGRIANCGMTAGPEVKVNLLHFFAKQLTCYGSYMGSLTELKAVLNMAEQGKIKPVVDSVFPLEKARDAQQHMLDRKHFGKIVLKVA